MADISIDRLNQLHPLIRQNALDAYAEAVRETPENVHPLITETYRSFAESDRLYAQGRTTPGHIVTKSKGGRSYHNFHLAADFALIVDGEISWIVNDNWMKVVDAFIKRGFTWGGNFEGDFKDYPHLECRLGHDWRELLELHNEGKFIPGTDFLDLG